MSPRRAEYLPSPQRSLGTIVILAAVMATAALVGVEWFQHELERRLSVQVEQELERKFPQVKWHVAGVRQTTGGILLSGVTATLPTIEGKSRPRPILMAEQVQLKGNLDTRHMMLGSTRIKEVVLVRPRLIAERLASGQWNLTKLRPAIPLLPKDVPAVEIKGGKAEITDSNGPLSGTIIVDNFQLRLTPPDEQLDSHWKLAVAATSRDFDALRLDARLDLESRQWGIEGTVSSLDVNNLFAALAARQMDVESLDKSTRISGDLDARFQLAGSLDSEAAVALEGHEEPAAKLRGRLDAELTNGQIQDDRLPYPVHGVAANVSWDGSGLRVDDITAHFGTARLAGFYQRLHEGGLSESMHLLVKHLAIDRQLVSRLPDTIREPMRSFDPVGMVDVNWSMEKGTGVNDRQLVITLQDMAFRYARFPYPLDSARGVIRLHNGMLTLENVRAYAHGQSLQFAAEIEDPIDAPRGWLKLAASGPVPLDDELLAALDPRSQQFMRSLQPSGQILLEQAAFQYDGQRLPAHRQLAVRLSDGAIRYKAFPYPINRLEGRFQLADKTWQFQDVTGVKGHAFLRCSGHGQLDAQGPRLAIDLSASDMALDDDLRDALGSLDLRTWQFWNSLNPSGSLDQVALTLRRDPGESRTRVALVAEKYRTDSDSGRVRGDGIRIVPSWFPYQLDNLSGSFSYADGVVALAGFRAQHDDAVIRFAADCQMRSDGEWAVDLRQLAVDNLEVDRDLLDALPGSIGPAVARLDPDGQYMFDGSLKLLHRNSHQRPVHASWDFTIETAGGELGGSTRLENLFGGVRLFGTLDDQGARTEGTIEIDSVQLREKQLTGIRGPLWIDRGQVLLGRWVQSVSGDATPHSLVGNCAGGTVQLDAQLIKNSGSRFLAEVRLADADLSRFSKSLTTNGRLSGRADAWIRLSGELDGVHTWKGNGQVRLRTADLDEAPVIMAIRRLVPRAEPVQENTSSTEIDLRIVADHVQLERIHVRGETLSLEGSGWMNLDRDINLRLYTVVGRGEIRLPLVKAVLAEASRKLLEINVKGSLENPQISSTALPELDDTLQRILVDLENRPSRIASPTVEEAAGMYR